MGFVKFFTDKTALARDSLANLVSGLGTASDKRSANAYAAHMLNAAQLIQAYSGAWIPRKIVDIPAQDAFRKWRDWQASKDEIGLLEAEEKRLNLQGKMLEAYTKARLLGGCALYIATGQNPIMPLDPNTIGKGGIKYVNVVSPANLSPGENEKNPESEFYGKPALYRLTDDQGRYLEIHPSRLVIFEGAAPADPNLTMGAYQGWGESVLNAVYRAATDADSVAANVCAAVFEMKVDIVKMPNLMEYVADPEYRARLLERFNLMQMSKSVTNTTIMDAAEEFETKTLSLGGTQDLIFAFMQIVAGAADIPVVRFLAQSPAGLNATGESDLKNYYDHISSLQTLKIAPAIRILDECLIRSALGNRPPELFYLWSSLWQMTDNERLDLGVKVTEMAKNLSEINLYPKEVLESAVSNALIEHGALPGLEDALNDLGESELAAWHEETEQTLTDPEAGNATREVQSERVGATA